MQVILGTYTIYVVTYVPISISIFQRVKGLGGVSKACEGKEKWTGIALKTVNVNTKCITIIMKFNAYYFYQSYTLLC